MNECKGVVVAWEKVGVQVDEAKNKPDETKKKKRNLGKRVMWLANQVSPNSHPSCNSNRLFPKPDMEIVNLLSLS